MKNKKMASMKNAPKANTKLLSFFRNVSLAVLASISVDMFMGFLLSNSVITLDVFRAGLYSVWTVLVVSVIWMIKNRIAKTNRDPWIKRLTKRNSMMN